MDMIKVFNAIWDNVENIILSRIMERLNKNVSSVEEFDCVYQYATRNFKYGNLIEGQWIMDLKAHNEQKANEFLCRLSKFRFQQVKYSQRSVFMGYVIAIIAGILTSSLLMNFADLALYKDILWGMFSTVVLSGILLPIFQDKQRIAKEKVVEQYKQQLESHRDYLIESIM